MSMRPRPTVCTTRPIAPAFTSSPALCEIWSPLTAYTPPTEPMGVQYRVPIASQRAPFYTNTHGDIAVVRNVIQGFLERLISVRRPLDIAYNLTLHNRTVPSGGTMRLFRWINIALAGLTVACTTASMSARRRRSDQKTPS